MIKQSKIFEVYEAEKGRRKFIYTKNLVPGKSVYGEKLVKQNNEEFREWIPSRSKLAAAMVKGCTNIFIRKDDVVLYLGAASGTTPSHVSDIVGKEGFVFALDFAPRVVRELVWLCEQRKNMTPLLDDALHPENYIENVSEVDIIYQDIAQRDQVTIFLKNCETFLKKGGYGLLFIKSRSIDVTKRPKDIYKDIKARLEKIITIIDFKDLDPIEKDHAMFIVKK